MIDLWVVLTIVTGVVLVMDLVTTQLRKRARYTPVPPDPTQKEIETDVQGE